MASLYLRILFLPVLFFATIVNALSQDITGSVTNIFGEALIGANIYWDGSDSGTTTDINGEFIIESVDNTEAYLNFSYIGFKSERIQPKSLKTWNIQLLEDNTITTVNVSAKAKATRYADDPMKIEVIGSREIERAACCSLAGCFSTNASVQSVTTNIITDSKELQILGLSGVYNQVLVDGVPIVQGLALPFGTGSYPGTLLDQIYVSKGANSVLQGAQGISGQINIITRKAETSPRLFLNAFVNSFAESQYNANYFIKKNKWNNVTAVHLTTPARIVDNNDDNFRDVVATERYSIYNKWTYNDPANTRFRSEIAARYWEEKRTGGHVSFDENLTQGVTTTYGQVVNTKHSDLSTKFNYSLIDNLAITTINSGFYQTQDDVYGLRSYIADQLNINSNLMLDYFYGESNNNLKVGISNIHNTINQGITERFLNTENIEMTRYDTQENLYGAYVENIYNAKPFTFIVGVRTDHFNNAGWKTSPRFMVRAALKENLDLRFSVGKGYRIAYPIAERNNLLANNRKLHIADDLKPEEAINIGANMVYNWTTEGVSSTLSIDGYHSLFQNQIFPDYDLSVRDIYIDNYFGNSTSNSFQIEYKAELASGFEFKTAYNYLDVYRIINDEKMLLNFVTKHKWMLNASYATADDSWQIDATYRLNGPKRLPATADYPLQYQRESISPTFSTLDLQMTKRWKNLDIYAGVENVFDFRQQVPLQAGDDPFGPYFDTSFTWGPIKGREIYAGLRYRID